MPTTPETPAKRIALARKMREQYGGGPAFGAITRGIMYTDLLSLANALADDLEVMTCADPSYHRITRMVKCHKCGRRFCRYHLFLRDEEMLCYDCLPPHSNYAERPESREETTNDSR